MGTGNETPEEARLRKAKQAAKRKLSQRRASQLWKNASLSQQPLTSPQPTQPQQRQRRSPIRNQRSSSHNKTTTAPKTETPEQARPRRRQTPPARETTTVIEGAVVGSGGCGRETPEEARQRRLEQATKRQLSKQRAAQNWKHRVPTASPPPAAASLRHTDPATESKQGDNNDDYDNDDYDDDDEEDEDDDDEGDDNDDDDVDNDSFRDAVMEEHPTDETATPKRQRVLAESQPRMSMERVISNARTTLTTTTAFAASHVPSYHQPLGCDMAIAALQLERERKMEWTNVETEWKFIIVNLRHRAELMERQLASLSHYTASTTTTTTATTMLWPETAIVRSVQEKLDLVSQESKVVRDELCSLAQKAHALSELNQPPPTAAATMPGST